MLERMGMGMAWECSCQPVVLLRRARRTIVVHLFSSAPVLHANLSVFVL